MITRLLLLAMLLPLAGLSQVQAQADGRYIEVTGTSEIEIVPDRIHYIIEIREYFEEEFDGRSKPEEYRTKISLDRIEQGLREVLHDAGISPNAVRTQEIGDYWRKQGQDFLVAKTFDITLLDSNRLMKSSNVWIPKASIPCASVNWKTRTCCPTIKKEKSQP